jgi:Outer membrane protein beta-barrel domain
MLNRSLRLVGMVALTLLSTPLTSQARSWHAGVRLGIDYADLRGSFADLANPKGKLGAAVGGFVDQDIAPALGLELEALYVQKGGTFESEETDDAGNVLGTIKNDLKLAYLEIPLLLQLRMTTHGQATPYLVGGLTFGIPLSASVERGFGLSDQDIKGQLKSPIAGFTGGLGVRIDTPQGRLALEARYGTDFGDLYDVNNNLESINQAYFLTLALSR